MTEYAPGIALANIHADIARADNKKKEAECAEEELRNKSRELFEEADKILRAKGNEHQKSVGRGPGGNTIGFRLQTENYLETPPAAIDFGGKKAKLVLSQGFSKGTGYTVNKDLIVLKAKFEENSEEKRIFLVSSKGEAENWLGESASLRDIDLVKSVLSQMNEILPEGKRSEDLRDAIEKARGAEKMSKATLLKEFGNINRQ